MEDTVNSLLELEDPGNWPSFISNQLRISIVKKGPIQVKQFKFPLNEDGRSFSESYYNKVMSNGEVVNRPWIIYSKKMYSVFCFSCRLFPNSLNKTYFINGLNDWKHLSERIKCHDTSNYHRKSNQQWIELAWRLDSNTTLDNEFQKEIDTEKKRWRSVLKRIIACIIYLAKQNDAFRGKNCLINTEHNGKFLKLIEMIASFDNPMAEH